MFDRISTRLATILVAIVVFCGLIHLPTIGIGELDAPDPRAQALLVIPSLLGAAFALSERRWQPFLQIPIALLLASTVWLSVSALFGPEPVDGVARGVWFGSTAITLVAAVDRRGFDEVLTTATLAMTAFVALGISLHVTGIVDGAWQVELASEPLFPWTRLNALGPNQTVIGLTGTLIVLSLFTVHRRLGPLASVIVGAIGLAGIGASHNRSAIAALAIGVLAAALWARRRWSLAVVAAGLAAVAAAVFSGGVSRRLNRDSLADDEAFDFYAGAERGVFTGRPEVWADAWHFAWQRPLIGRGSGAFAQHTDQRFLSGSERWDPNHAHNTVLEVFADQGLVGVVLLGAFVIAVARMWRRWTVTSVAVFAALATHGMVEATFYGSPSSRWTILVIVVAGLCRRRPTDEAQRADQRRGGQADSVGEQRRVGAAPHR